MTKLTTSTKLTATILVLLGAVVLALSTTAQGREVQLTPVTDSLETGVLGPTELPGFAFRAVPKPASRCRRLARRRWRNHGQAARKRIRHGHPRIASCERSRRKRDEQRQKRFPDYTRWGQRRAGSGDGSGVRPELGWSLRRSRPSPEPLFGRPHRRRARDLHGRNQRVSAEADRTWRPPFLEAGGQTARVRPAPVPAGRARAVMPPPARRCLTPQVSDTSVLLKIP